MEDDGDLMDLEDREENTNHKQKKELFDQPVTLHCSHSFCHDCAIKVLNKNPLCPFCRRPFTDPIPGVNAEIEALVKKFLDAEKGDNPDIEPTDSTRDQESPFFWLPPFVLVDIFEMTGNYKELANYSQVCHHFNNMASDNWLWREICKEKFPFISVDKYDKSWKKAFTARSKVDKGWDQGKPGDFEVTTFRGHSDYVSCFKFYHQNVVSGSADSTVRIWNVNNEDFKRELTGHDGIINDINFNELRIVSGSDDCTVKLWDTQTGAGMRTIRHNGPVKSIAFDENQLVTGSEEGNVKLFDIRTGEITHTFDGLPGVPKKVLIDQNRLISNTETGIQILDPRTGYALHHLNTVDGSKIKCFDVFENRIITGSQNGRITKFNCHTGANEGNFNTNHQSEINCIQTDGKKVITGSSDNTLKVFNYQTKQEIKTLKDHTAPIHDAQFLGNRLVSCSADNTLKVWNIETGTRMYSLLGGSLQRRGNNKPNPIKPGCSGLQFDESRIVGSFSSLLRSYSFEIDN